MGVTEENQDEYLTASAFARAPADEAWVFACVRRIYTAGQSVPLRIYVRQSNGDLVTAEDANDSDGLEAQFVLDNVNPVDMNGNDLKAHTFAGYAVWGGSYWQKVRGRLGGRPQELYYLRVPDVRVQSTDGRRVDYYDYRPERGSAQQFLPRDVLAFKTVNLEHPLEPLSPLSAARYAISVNKQGAKWNAKLLQNSGVPQGYWQALQEISPQDKGILQRLFRGLKGPANAGKTPFIPYELDYKVISLLPKDAEWIAAGKASRLAVCAALGVPPVLAGDDEKTNVYGNVREARRIFWLDTMIPLLDWYADVLNGWFLPDFDPERTMIGSGKIPNRGKLFAAFDYSQVEALQEPLTQRVQSMVMLADRRALVPDELRSIFRLGKPYATDWSTQPAPTQTRITLTGLAPQFDAGIGETISPPPQPEELEPGGGYVADPDYVEQVRSWRGFYRRPEVRAFIAHGGPLAADSLFGRPVPDAIRTSVEDGIRRRWSATQIADALETEPNRKQPDEMALAVRALADAVAAQTNAPKQPIHVELQPAQVTVSPAPVTFEEGAISVTLPAGRSTKTVVREGGVITKIVEE